MYRFFFLAATARQGRLVPRYPHIHRLHGERALAYAHRLEPARPAKVMLVAALHASSS
jgi:hypothetical protein